MNPIDRTPVFPNPNHRSSLQSRREPCSRSDYFKAAQHPASTLGFNPATHVHSAFDHTPDVPLDAFDKQLLAELPRLEAEAEAPAHTRLSLPQRYFEAYPQLEHNRAIRDDLYQMPLKSSSPPSNHVVSSPTVRVLHNRQALNPRFFQQNNHGPVTEAETHDQRPHDVAKLTANDATPVVQRVPLVCTAELPDRIRAIFPFELLNAVQSKCFSTAFRTDDNLVLSAPTGSGKTAVMELAVARLLMSAKNTDFKIVYMAPIKALCAERQQDWQRKFNMHGLNCAELTGDTEYDQLRKVQQAQIIITTPEKWDSVTRKWRDNLRLVQMIKLFLVDEVHILKDTRGATLEAVVSRMKSVGTPIRFIALSATVPNSEDIAAWLGKDSTCPHLPAQREVFDESFRPVKLEKHVYGFQGGSNDFQFDVKLRHQVPEMIMRHSKEKPTMVFCMTRKSSAQTAAALAALWNQSQGWQKPWAAPRTPITVKDLALQALVSTGVAFHHAGMSVEDRKAVEQGFSSSTVKVICSTSTLAVGVNLPCYMVILQGTMGYCETGPQEYSDLEIMQMLGRAGRPQFETSACAVILTREDKIDRYRRIVSGQEILESTLHRNLIEHLNAEIGLGTVLDLDSAKRWLASTFLSVRLRKNPTSYQLQEGFPSAGFELLQQICEKDVSLLADANLVDRSGHLKCTELGEAMARYYVKFETMKTFAAIPPKAKVSEILNILSQAAEFLDIRMRGGEKSFYRELNKANEIRFPIKVDIALPSHKVSLILQAQLGSVQDPSGPNFDKHQPQYRTDAFAVFAHANRLIRCIIDCELFLKDSVSAKNALELARSLAARAWDNTPNTLRQIQGVGDVYMRKLASKGVNNIDTLLATEPQRIDLICGKSNPFGADLLKKLNNFPDLMVTIKEVERKIHNGKGVTLKVKCEVGFLNKKTPMTFGSTSVYVCFLVEDSNGGVLDFRRFGARKLGKGEEILLTVELIKPTAYIRSHVMCDEIADTARYAELHLQGLAASVYPKIENVNSAPSNDVQKQRAFAGRKPSSNPDAFDDDGVGDDDLLAASGQPGTKDIQYVHDIDDLMPDKGSDKGDSLQTQGRFKQQHSKVSQDNIEDDEEVDYKDPVRLDNGRWTCQHLCKDKGIECKHKCCREGVAKPKRRPNKVNKISEQDGDQQKLTSVANNASKKVSPVSGMGTRSLEKAQSPVLPTRLPLTEKGGDHGCNTKRRLSTVEDISDLSLERPSKKVRTETLGHSGTPEKDHGNSSKATDDLPELESLMWDASDCDWGLPPSYQPQHSPSDQDESPIRPIGVGLRTTAMTHSSQLDEAPLEHVSISETKLKTGQSLFSTSDQSVPAKTKEVANVGQPQVSPEERFGTPFDISDFIDDSRIDAITTVQKKVCQSEEQVPIKSAQKTAALLPADGVAGEASTVEVVETEQEKSKRCWEADQKKKWDQLEPWLYEQFHDFVELI